MGHVCAATRARAQRRVPPVTDDTLRRRVALGILRLSEHHRERPQGLGSRTRAWLSSEPRQIATAPGPGRADIGAARRRARGASWRPGCCTSVATPSRCQDRAGRDDLSRPRRAHAREERRQMAGASSYLPVTEEFSAAFSAAQEDRSVRWLQAVIGEKHPPIASPKSARRRPRTLTRLSTVRARAPHARARAVRPRDDPPPPPLRIGAAPLSGRRPAPLPFRPPPPPPTTARADRAVLRALRDRGRAVGRGRRPAPLAPDGVGARRGRAAPEDALLVVARQLQEAARRGLPLRGRRVLRERARGRELGRVPAVAAQGRGRGADDGPRDPRARGERARGAGERGGQGRGDAGDPVRAEPPLREALEAFAAPPPARRRGSRRGTASEPPRSATAAAGAARARSRSRSRPAAARRSARCSRTRRPSRARRAAPPGRRRRRRRRAPAAPAGFFDEARSACSLSSRAPTSRRRASA